jgi:hypothetical protein
MALFKPEVKDTGSTNVSAYAPSAMDYSGIGNFAKIIAAFEPEERKLTAEERKEIELRPLADVYAKADVIKQERGNSAADYYVKKSIIQFRKDNPHLASEITAYQDGLKKSGLEENVFENMLKSSVEAFQQTDEGKLKTQQRLNEYTDQYGNVDTDRLYAALYTDAQEYNTGIARINQLERDAKVNAGKESELIDSIGQRFYSVDTSAASVNASPQGIQRTIAFAKQNAKDTPEALTNASGFLKQQEIKRRAEFSSRLAANNIVKTDEEINNLMKVYNPNLYYSIAAIEAVSTMDKKYTTQASEQALANVVSRMPPGGVLLLDKPLSFNVAVEKGFIPSGELEKIGQPLKDALNNVNVEAVPKLPWDGVNPNPIKLPENYSPDDLSKNSQKETLNMFTEEAQKYVSSIPDQTKQEIMLKTEALLTTYKSGQVGSIMPGNLQASALSNAYLIQMYTAPDTAATNKNINTIFGDKAFTFISDISKQDPAIGSALGKQASTYAQYESSKQFNRFNQLYVGQIDNDIKSSPFILEEKNGSLELNVRSSFENDRYISQARIVKKGFGIEETKDSYRILGNWATTGFVGPFAAGQGKEMVEKIKNIQLLYRNSFRLPDQYGSTIREYILTMADQSGLR